MGLVDELTSIVAPVVASSGVELVDVEQAGGTVRVVVDEPGGIGLDRLSEITLAVSRALDQRDPLPGRYTLEVSSPGLERPLRRPSHFQAAVGRKVSLRVVEPGGSHRVVGVVVAADDDAVTIRPDPSPDADADAVRLPYANVDRARTIFEWGPGPKPGKGTKPGARKRARTAGRGGDEHPPTGHSVDEADAGTPRGEQP